MPKPSNRPKLLAVGGNLMHERGFAATTVRDLVQAAGVPQGCFTNHFASKESFGLEVINEHFNQTLELLNSTLRDRHLEPLKGLEAFVDATVAQARGDGARKGCLFGNFSIEASPYSEVIRQRLVEIFDEVERAIESCIDDAKESGELAPEQDSKEIAALVMSSLQGATLLAKTRHNGSTVETVKHALFTTILATGRSSLPAKQAKANLRRSTGSRRAKD